MKAEKFREQTDQEILNTIDDLVGELFNLRFQLATGQLENPRRIAEVKKDIARAKTVLRERELKAAQA